MIGRHQPRARKLSSASVLNETLLRSKSTTRTEQVYVKVRGKYLCRGPENVEIPIRSFHMTLFFARGAEIDSRDTGSGSVVAPFTVGNVAAEPGTTGPTLPNGIAEGARVNITYSGSPDPIADQWYFLRDVNEVEINSTTETTRPIGGELVQVESVNTSTHKVTLRQAAGRSYASNTAGGNTILSTTPVDNTCTNIGIRGLRVRGVRDLAGDRGTIAWLNIGYVAGLSLQNCHGEQSWSTGTRIAYSRDVEVMQCSGSQAGGGSTGAGYALQIKQCSHIKVRDVWANDARYACMLEQGCTVFEVSGLAGQDLPTAVFDIHGGNTYKGTVSNIAGSATTTIQFGNQSWVRGCSDVTIRDSLFGKLSIQGEVSDLNVNDCDMSHVQLYGYEVDEQQYFPQINTFARCNITTTSNNHSIYIVPTSFSCARYIGFSDCTIQANETARLQALSMAEQASDTSFTLEECSVYGNPESSTPGLMVLASDNVSLTCIDSVFHIPANSGTDLYYVATGEGTFVAQNNEGATVSYRVPPAVPSHPLESDDFLCVFEED